jgi:hypothetical protein
VGQRLKSPSLGSLEPSPDGFDHGTFKVTNGISGQTVITRSDYDHVKTSGTMKALTVCAMLVKHAASDVLVALQAAKSSVRTNNLAAKGLAARIVPHFTQASACLDRTCYLVQAVLF